MGWVYFTRKFAFSIFLATFQYFTTFAGREVSTFFEKQSFANLFLNDDQLERLIERPLSNLYFQIQTKSRSSLKVDLQNFEWYIPEKIETGGVEEIFSEKTPGIFRFVTYKFRRKQVWKFCKIT